MSKSMDVTGYHPARRTCRTFNCLLLSCVAVNVFGMMVKRLSKSWSLLTRIDCYHRAWSVNWWTSSKGGEDGRFTDQNGTFHSSLLCRVKTFVSNLPHEGGLCPVLISFGASIHLSLLYLYTVSYINCCTNSNWRSRKMWLLNDHIPKIFEVRTYLSGISHGLFGKKRQEWLKIKSDTTLITTFTSTTSFFRNMWIIPYIHTIAPKHWAR